MNGGFNPIKDLYKTEVYAWRAGATRMCPTGALGPARRRHPREHHRPRRRPRNCARTRPTRICCRPTTSLDDILRCLVEKEMRVADDRRARPRRRDGEEGRAAALSRRIQAPAGGARRQDSARQFRPRPALSDHQPLPRGRRLYEFDILGQARREGGPKAAGSTAGRRHNVSFAPNGRRRRPFARALRLACRK